MSCGLTQGRKEIECRDNIGGVRNVYLFKYIDYAYNQIGGVRGVNLTSFPETAIFKYETTNATFSQTINNDENGVYYSQSLTFVLYKQDLVTSKELEIATNIDLRYIVEFNDGTFRIGGLFNGARISSLRLESGGNKNSLNGYSVTIEGSEEYAAAFLDNLDIIAGSANYIFMDGNNFIFMDGNNYIFN